MILRNALVSALFVLAACGGPMTGDEFNASEAELRGGCRAVCPKCRPGEVCPRIACFLDCNGKSEQAQASHRGEPCGDKTCASGEVCCNASCGICTPPDGYCIQMVCSSPGPTSTCSMMAACTIGYEWSEAKCTCVKSAAPAQNCSSDADCYLTANYCDGCACEAHFTGDPIAACTGTMVQCFADPCGFGQVAACVAGTCSVVTP